jgi:serine/threonine-protein kinase RsbW
VIAKRQEGRSWIIIADLALVDRLCKDLNAWLVEQGIGDTHLFALQMLAREALNNAVIHGCGEKSSLQVGCEIRLEDRWIHLVVKDGGPGFNWRAYQALDMAAVNQCSGRGLKIYKLYADQVLFNDTGNQISLNRNLDNHQPQDELQPG